MMKKRHFRKPEKAAVARMAVYFLLFMGICTALGGQIERLMTPIVTFDSLRQSSVLSSECVHSLNGHMVIYLAIKDEITGGETYTVQPQMVEVLDRQKGEVTIQPLGYLPGSIIKFSTKELAPGQRVRKLP